MLTHKDREWIVLADRAHAEIYTRNYVDGVMQRHLVLEHPAARQFQHDQGTDRPGRGKVPGTNKHQAYEDHADFPEQESAAFLKSVSREVDQAAQDGEMDKLILVALPKTMKLIKSEFSDQTKEKVAGEYAKNLVNVAMDTLPDRLDKLKETG